MRNNARIIGRNFLFMGLEVVITLVVTLLTSVFIARVVGPARLGYFNLITWLTSIACSLGSFGLPLSTFKYMGEFLGSGEKELAGAVYLYNLRAMVSIATAITVLTVVAVLIFVDPRYRVCSALIALSVLPAMVTFIPSQANTAAENSSRNTTGAFAGAVVYVLIVVASLLHGWDLTGIAAAVLLSRVVELVVKLIPVQRFVAQLAPVPLPREVRKRMFTFSGFSTALLVVQTVIWDRSDVVFLKVLQPDIRQLAFFSVCFSISDRLVLPVQAFASALSATQVSEYGRDKNSLFRITSDSFVYLLMGALPIMTGIACVSAPFIRFVYGPLYTPAIPVFFVVALLSIPKSVLTPAQTLLYSAEEMPFVLKWGMIASVANIALDITLIPHHGATGAALANGIAQTFAVTVLWTRLLTRYPIRPRVSVLVRLLGATLAMAIVAFAVVATPLSAGMKLATAIPAGAIAFLIVGRLVRLWQNEDRRRLLMLSGMVPALGRHWYERLVDLLIPGSPVAEASS